MAHEIILSSGSIGATPEAIEKVLSDNGYESEKPAAAEAATAVIEEPKREDFDTDEAFEAAQDEFEQAQEEAEAAGQGEGDEEDETERKPAAAAAQPVRKSRRQRAIEKATAALKDENRKLAERVAALENNKPGAAKKLEDLIAEAVAKVPKPKRANYKEGAEGDAEYEGELITYGRKVAEVERQARAAAESQQKQQSQLQKNFEAYQTSVAAFKKEHDDWDEVVNDKTPISEGVYLAVIRANSPAVTYYLATNPEVLAELNEMDAIGAAMEIKVLAEKLKKKKPGEVSATTGATTQKPKPRVLPTPVRPVATAAANSTLSSKDAAAKRDFKAFKAAQRAGR